MPRKGKGSKVEAQAARSEPMPVQTAPGQPYGARTAQEEAQQALPMGRAPGDRGSFARPSERPQQPLTEGAPFGPGRGQDILRYARPTPSFGSDPAVTAMEKAAMLTQSPLLMDLVRRRRRL